MSDLVIIGAGLTSAAAIETLRAEGFAGSITLIGAEALPPYERPQLSKDLLKGSEFATLHDEQWYADRKVSLRLGVAATAIDRDVRTVALADGSWVPYDLLLIATGASPRVPDLPGIERAITLRTKADAEGLLASFSPGASLVTIGGGWIGLEVAAAARDAGLSVTVLERGEKPLQGALGNTLADHLVKLHARHGILIRSGVDVASVGDSTVTLVNGEEIAADVVVAAIGAVPNDQLAAAVGLATDHGIVTGDHLQTADPAIFAAGDVAVAEHLELGPLRVEHWDNAIKQGHLAARSILGQHVHYDWAPYFYTDQFEFSMEYVGHGSPDDEVVIRGELGRNEFIAYWLRPPGSGDAAPATGQEASGEGRVLTAAMNVGIWDVNDRLRAMIGTAVHPDELTDLRAA